MPKTSNEETKRTFAHTMVIIMLIRNLTHDFRVEITCSSISTVVKYRNLHMNIDWTSLRFKTAQCSWMHLTNILLSGYRVICLHLFEGCRWHFIITFSQSYFIFVYCLNAHNCNDLFHLIWCTKIHNKQRPVYFKFQCNTINSFISKIQTNISIYDWVFAIKILHHFLLEMNKIRSIFHPFCSH